MDAGSTNFELNGPFGYPVQIENYGTVICIGTGWGILMLLPVLTALRAAGNRIISVLSASSKEGMILQNEAVKKGFSAAVKEPVEKEDADREGRAEPAQSSVEGKSG